MWRYITLLVLIIAILFAYHVEILNYFNVNNNKNAVNRLKLFTPEEISQYNGVKKPELYLVILGNVFDVTKGAKYYGPDKAYHVFIGQDASRSFVTGKFTQDHASDDVTGLSFAELRSIKHWLDFYKKEYKKIGKLIGKYYDEHGKVTPYGREIKKLIQTAETEERNNKLDDLNYPPCNVEWDKDRGTRVWCTKRSGGIERSWVGVPRKYYKVGEKTFRCACIKEDYLGFKNIEQYEGCPINETSCFIKI